MLWLISTTADFWNTGCSTWNCTKLNFWFFSMNLYVSDYYQVTKLRDEQLLYVYLVREIESITKTNILKLIRLVYRSLVAALHKFTSLNVILLATNVKSNIMIIKKQPTRALPRKRCSDNLQQIYRTTRMLKCYFNKVALQLYWNHTLAWVFSGKFAAYFQNTFFKKYLWVATSNNIIPTIQWHFQFLPNWPYILCPTDLILLPTPNGDISANISKSSVDIHFHK